MVEDFEMEDWLFFVGGYLLGSNLVNHQTRKNKK
jgi:hypothetical protein